MRVFYFLAYLLQGVSRKISHKLVDFSCKSQVEFGKSVRFTKTARVENSSRKIESIKLGDNVLIEGRLLVFKNGGSIAIGDNSYVGNGANIWSRNKIIIGKNVLISHNVDIIDTNSHEIDHKERMDNYLKNQTSAVFHDENVATAPIIIEDNAWISFGVKILKGVTIGKGAIIGAGSIVTKDVEPFSLVVGNPAKVVKKLK